MSKSFRGRNLRELPAKGRGFCVQCNRDNVKILNEVEIDGAKVKICKICKATNKNKAKKESKAS